MAAIIGLEHGDVQADLRGSFRCVVPARSPMTMAVASCHLRRKGAVEKAAAWLRKGRKACHHVAGFSAFHSALMGRGADAMREALAKVEKRIPSCR